MRCLILIFLLQCLGATLHADPREVRQQRLANVSSWFYHIGFLLEEDTVQQMATSPYDMLVIEPIFTESENRDYPIKQTIARLKAKRADRLVLAYIDIGEAEEWRTYWQQGWKIGAPEWIVADDPDGWEGNYPVAFWHDDWWDIWTADEGQIAQLVDAGFDGVYLDWVEAYSDENVVHAAQREDIDPRLEMISFVGGIAEMGRSMNPEFLIVAQNAAELADSYKYSHIIDALAQEQVWYDGGSDNVPKGDCPLPATDADIETDAYINSLSDLCRQQHDEYAYSTLHVSSAEYIRDLQIAQAQDLRVFTVDYAVQPQNISRVRKLAGEHGFVPFVGERALDRFWLPE